MKKILFFASVMLAVILTLASCGGDENEQGLQFILNDGGTYSVSIGEAVALDEIVIPSEYSGKAVTKIASNAFPSDALKKITIPESVNYIDPEAFAESSSLEEIIVDEDSEYFKSVDGVLYDASGSNLICYPQAISGHSFSLPTGVKVICENAFIATKHLVYIIVDDGIDRIDNDAFRDIDEDIAIYYEGSLVKWNSLKCKYIGDAEVYCYSETKPTQYGSFWYYEDDVPVSWKKYSSNVNIDEYETPFVDYPNF